MVATTKDKKKYKTIKKKVDKTVESPCTNVCKYDIKEEFCIGCYRTKEELQDWWITVSYTHLTLPTTPYV